MPEMTARTLLIETQSITKRIRAVLAEGASIAPGSTLARDLDKVLTMITRRLENDRGPYRDPTPAEGD